MTTPPNMTDKHPLLRFEPRRGPRPARIVAPEGLWATLHTLGEPPSPEASPAHSSFNLMVVEPSHAAPSNDPDHPDSPSPPWLPSARAAVEAALLEIESAYPLANLLLWPHADGAISDAPSLRTFLRSRGVSAGGRWRFIYDAAALLTPPMRTNIDDHLLRWSEVLVTHPDLAAVVLCEHSPMASLPGPMPLAQGGTLSTPLICSLAALPPGIPVILLDVAADGSDARIADQTALLAAAGALERRTI